MKKKLTKIEGKIANAIIIGWTILCILVGFTLGKVL